MKVLVLLRAEILDILLLLFLLGYNLYCNKYRQREKEFTRLLFACVGHAIFALITEITVNSDNVSKEINLACHMVLYYFALLFCCQYFRYIANTIFPDSKVIKKILVFFNIGCILMMIALPFFPVEYVEGEATKYSAGAAPSICYAVAFLIVTVSDALLFIYRKRAKNQFFIVFPISIITMSFWIIQIFVPELLFTSSSVALFSLSIFLAVEYPISRLYSEAYIDIDTKTYNRNAYDVFYDETKREIEKSTVKIPLTYVLFDVNDLKKVNDDYGHYEGDKLIAAAASAITTSVKSAGKVYRVGGDEFAAIYDSDDEMLVKSELKRLKEVCRHESKKLKCELHIAYGYAILKPKESLFELIKRADAKMYENKEKYYLKRGIDRRAQQRAFVALCNNYEKFLVVNLVKDNYYIIKMDEAEKSKEYGYENSISAWFKSFAKSKMIHKNDVSEFLKITDIEKIKQHFIEGNEKLTFYYRRKKGNEYRKTMMEIFKTEAYDIETQQVYLCVLYIDR